MGHTDTAHLRAALEAGEAPQIVDVREPWEQAQGVIDGAILMPMADVRSRFGELDAVRPINVICHLGSRSAMVGQFLTRQGLAAINVDDGMDGWQRAGFPTVKPGA